ncbi:respiratory nitrate reductase subunit gamma [Vulcanisaeta thermophila]|uniref:respiratory nitrate reductase subunit gamma n=1 Tax=Vulcanisaeta thermophila TaxID=867917 RepID=UPI000853E417|nr:respiratory nitrate reductase subunit gamma [Vulcanisaeta thermophila]
MASTLFTVVFGYIPYLVVLIFILGIIYRLVSWIMSHGLTGLYSVAVMPYRDNYGKVTTEVLKRIFLFYTLNTADRELLIGSVLFHWGIWIVLLGHLGVILPESTLAGFGITPSLHILIAKYLGGAAGLMALVGLLILLARRVRGSYINVYEFRVRVAVPMLSYLDDYFALSILLAIVIVGLAQTLWLESVQPGFFEYDVTPWINYLASFNISKAVAYISSAPPITLAHVILAMIFIAYFPWGKLIHPLSFLLMPTVTRPSIKIRQV